MTVEIKDGISPLLAALSEQLGGTFTVKATVSEPDTEDKIKWLKDAKRDFLAVTPQMESAATLTAATVLRQQVSAANRGIAFDIMPVIQAFGEGAWAHVLLRFRGGKRDVPMTALTQKWLARKAAAKKPALIGHGLTGDLVTDLANATITVRRSR